MKEFIEELKHNREVNIEKGLENRVDIDYVIERLKDIDILEEHIKNEVNYRIETLVNDDCLDYQKKEDLYSMSDEVFNNIVNKICDDDSLIESINITFNEAIDEELWLYLDRNMK